MTQKVILLIAWATLASGVALQAAPTPTPAPAATSAGAETEKQGRSTSSQRGKKARSKTPLKVTPTTPLPVGWSIQNGEWVHSEGYKYVNGQLIRTVPPTQRTPPRPPSKAALNAAASKIKPVPTPPPNTAAAKAAEIERNKRPRYAPQTGSNL